MQHTVKNGALRVSWRARIGTTLLVLVGLSTGLPVRAQDGKVAFTDWRFEVGPYAGAYIPTGNQRDFVTGALLTGLQLSVLPHRRFALTVNYGWAATRDRQIAESRALDTYQMDIGGEWRMPACYRRGSWQLVPFVGAGAGGRTYDYRDVAVSSRTDMVGYAAVGGEVDFGGWGIRLEARDHRSQSRTLAAPEASPTMRNDINIASGFSRRF